MGVLGCVLPEARARRELSAPIPVKIAEPLHLTSERALGISRWATTMDLVAGQPELALQSASVRH